MKNILYVLLILLISCGVSTEPTGKRDKPTNLKAFNTLNDEVYLTWDDNSNEEIGFLIARQNSGSEFVIVDTTNANVNYYIDNDVEKDSLYIYRVAALFDNEVSDWSNEVQIVHQFYFSEIDFGNDDTFDIVTWNIEHFPKAGQSTLDYVSNAIVSVDADVYAFQEIENSDMFYDMIDQINALDLHHTWAGYRASTASYDVNLAFIYKSDEVQVVDIFEIYQNESRPFPRRPLVMNCFFDNQQFYIIDNHLKAGGDGTLDPSNSWDEETRRLEACNLLDEYITQNLPDNNVIVLGDMNDELDDSSANNVFQNLIDNTQEYLFADMQIALGTNNYWSYPSWPSHLDHILITNELFDEFGLSDSSIETILLDEYLDGNWNEYDTNISDHRPVGLNLDLNE